MAKPQYSGPWQRIRPQILARDGGTCQIGAPGCTTIATQVDHITPVHAGGAWYDPTNLRAACANCNNRRADNKPTEQWRTAKTRIVLVIGPPGAGKTTWVADNKGPNDLVVDYDQLAGAIGGAPNPTHDAPLSPSKSKAKANPLRLSSCACRSSSPGRARRSCQRSAASSSCPSCWSPPRRATRGTW